MEQLSTFDKALAACKGGAKIRRSGWNGAKLGLTGFVVYQKAYPQGIAINANTSESIGLPEKTMCAFEPYLMLAVELLPGDSRRGENDNKFICRPWTPDMRDLLSTDWIIEPKRN